MVFFASLALSMLWASAEGSAITLEAAADLATREDGLAKLCNILGALIRADVRCRSILALTDTIFRCISRRLGRGRFFNSNGLVRRGCRLTNWVVKGLAIRCSTAKPRHCVSDR